MYCRPMVNHVYISGRYYNCFINIFFKQYIIYNIIIQKSIKILHSFVLIITMYYYLLLLKHIFIFINNITKLCNRMKLK